MCSCSDLLLISTLLQAIRKLEQVVQQRVMMMTGSGGKAGGKAQSSELLRKDHELRKCRGDLEKERHNVAQMQRRFQDELSDIQSQMTEEQDKRRQLQKDLMEREDQIDRLQRLMPIPEATTNGGLKPPKAAHDIRNSPSPSRTGGRSPSPAGSFGEAPPKSVASAREAVNVKTGMCRKLGCRF